MSESLLDWRRGLFRIYLSRGCWGRPGLALRFSIGHKAVVAYRPYIELADLWVGIFHREVRYADNAGHRGRDFWVCPLPCIVFKFHLTWREA